jgi:hypothetical protein
VYVVTICRMRAFMLAGRNFVALDHMVHSHGCDLFPTSYIRYRCVVVPPIRRARWCFRAVRSELPRARGGCVIVKIVACMWV